MHGIMDERLSAAPAESWNVTWHYAVLMYHAHVEDVTEGDDQMLQIVFSLADAHETDRFRLGKTFARRLKDISLLNKARTLAGQAAGLPVPDSQRPVPRNQDRPPPAKCVLCGSSTHQYSDPARGGKWEHGNQPITIPCRVCGLLHARQGPKRTACGPALAPQQ